MQIIHKNNSVGWSVCKLYGANRCNTIAFVLSLQVSVTFTCAKLTRSSKCLIGFTGIHTLHNPTSTFIRTTIYRYIYGGGPPDLCKLVFKFKQLIDFKK